uniref:Ankyrin repeat domain 63 n=1 Tax=Erpetoichthys calabaricus TaxID=27687 RepID=A0A8C4XEW3_ERPCA
MLRPRDLCQDSGTKTFLDAMQNGQVHLARFVLDAMDGRIINSKTENNKTPLMYAVTLPEAGSRMKFARLLLEKGADVNCQDEHGRTALSLACEMGHLDVVKLLVQFSANPEITDAWGNGALAYASCEGHTHILDFLVRAFKRLGITTGQVSSGSRPSLPWQVSSGQLNQEQSKHLRCPLS